MSEHSPLPRTRRGLRAATLGALSLAAASPQAGPLAGGSYVLVGAPATGGSSSGGGYVLSGYVAGAGAGASTGEAFNVTCGLLGLYPGPLAEVALNVALMPDGRVRIWWSPELAGYALEVASTLGTGADWQPTGGGPAGSEHLTLPAHPARFYRLRAP
jgi:hypothetical protein